MFQKKVALPLVSSQTTLGLPTNDSFAKVVTLYRNILGFNVGLSRGITEKGGIEDKKNTPLIGQWYKTSNGLFLNTKH